MTACPGGIRTAALAAAAMVMATVAAAPPATAGVPEPRPATTPATASGAAPRLAARPAVGETDQSMRLDRSAKVFTATGYQTLTVLGLVGGAAAIGALAGGASGAVAAGAAVLLGYTLMR
ncbi:hypothetical protein GCM10017083_50640 [Thalassobaculum fulvum]|uniref:Uncharacterized protein n=2 Tax=Thalassobaculum fulvum TaxID=1633335 RepID=A0A918XXZ0_9PROT|nr:hypothetical protein GCM10017083_50640 [Thalassobaculum fulvum]